LFKSKQQPVKKVVHTVVSVPKLQLDTPVNDTSKDEIKRLRSDILNLTIELDKASLQQEILQSDRDRLESALDTAFTLSRSEEDRIQELTNRNKELSHKYQSQLADLELKYQQAVEKISLLSSKSENLTEIVFEDDSVVDPVVAPIVEPVKRTRPVSLSLPKVESVVKGKSSDKSSTSKSYLKKRSGKV
jgi:hypothetical protein